jgi:uncharacterized membrane protein
MLTTMVEFANLLVAALVVGTMFGVWLSFNPAGLEATAWVVQQRQGIRGLNVTMPVLGSIAIVLTIATAVLARTDRTRVVILVAAAASFAAAGLITRLLNQPINAIVMTWPADAPPANWTRLRDNWWRWHILRTSIGIGGLCLLIAAILDRSGF